MVTPHPDTVKAAVLAALLTGQSVSAVARDYQIPRTTVIRWKDESGLLSDRTVSDTKKTELGDLIADYLRENLLTLSVQARAFRGEAWLDKQPASEAAVLHGVLADKAIRILGAIDNGSEPRAESTPTV